jgi:prevent-host-death family protein
MKKQVGLFEAKTKLSEICAAVQKTGEAVTITKRGQPIVVISPVSTEVPSLRDRLEQYRAQFAESEAEEEEFVLPPRSREFRDFQLDE